MFTAERSLDPEHFVRELIDRQFGSGLVRRPPYRLMFESKDKLVYVQNFNKRSERLWYRVTEKPWKELQSIKKEGWVCFTNPAQRYAYVIPAADIQIKLKASPWKRSYLEVNIDPASHRWVELEWNIQKYLKIFDEEVAFGHFQIYAESRRSVHRTVISTFPQFLETG